MNNEEENIYEEEFIPKVNGNKKVKVFLIILIVLIIGFGAYITYLKLNEEKDSKETTPTPAPVVEVQNIDFDCADNTCTDTLKVANKDVKVLYEKTVQEDESVIHKVSIDDHVILNENLSCGGPSSLKVLDDTLVLSYHSGCDINGNIITAYSIEGVELFKYEYLDPLTKLMRVDGTTFEVKDKKISIKGTRLTHGPAIEVTNGIVDLCEQTNWAANNIDLTTVLSATYEIAYQGNLAYEQPIVVSSETAQDKQILCDVDGE